MYSTPYITLQFKLTSFYMWLMAIVLNSSGLVYQMMVSVMGENRAGKRSL